MSSKSVREREALQKRIAGLSAEKRAFFELLLRAEQEPVAIIKPRDRRLDPPPVTFAQEQLWFLDRLVPGNWFYNESSALHLRFPLNHSALEQALNEVVRRHEILRTSFAMAKGEVVQIITPELRLQIPVVDLSHLPTAEREEEARRLAAQDAQLSFDLAVRPLIRSTLLRLGRAESIFLLTMHHIIFDGWSFTILLRELSQLYEAYAAGRPSSLPALSIQYADFAVWQRKSLRGEALEAKMAYWRKYLAGLPQLHLPTDRPRPPVQSFRGERCPVVISEPLCVALKALSVQEGLTLFITLLTAFKTLLHRYSDQDQIVVGVPVANRDRVEIEGLIGLFVNTLVMRTDFSGDPTFREALARVRKIALEAFEHQDVPFEKLVEELHPNRDLSRNPLFQITFQIYGSSSESVGDNPSLEDANAPFDVDARTAKFDLRFDLAEKAGGLTGFLEYDTELFDHETIASMARHFNVLLESAVADPGRRLSELAILLETERRQLLIQWNSTASEYPRDKCIQDLFEAQAERSAAAVAVECKGELLTYGELNRKANQLAHYLQGLGIGPDVMVGISGERSLQMIVGLLAILKAGGAYLPLDLDEPRDRLTFMVDNARVRVILTKERQLFHLADRGIRVIPLSTEGSTVERQPDFNPVRTSRPDSLAYAMYTSGSTGRPKGVCVPHRAVVRLVSHTNCIEVSGDDVFLQFAPLSFDASTFEIWSALLNGARLFVFPPYVPSPEELGDTIHRHGVTILWLTAALFHHMVENRLDSLAGVHQFLAGGDVLSGAHMRKVLERFPDCRLTNGYGPTENTTFTCTYSTSNIDGFGATPPIGRPISNTRVYVLDRYRNPVPIGVPGELFAGGDGLARGYLNDPELTAEKFVSDPFDADGGGRLYRTGDLVRYRRSGDLEFLGRLDNQVKVRGFRVELGEIEAVVRSHAAVRDVVCLAREDTPGDKRLVAYVTAGEVEVTASELRRFLEGHLPDYMLPSVIVFLDSLPVTPNGKVDRRALPAPDPGRTTLDTDYVAPATEVERRITGLWQEVLGVSKVGVNDNFFDLGGHSLLVVLLHNRLKEAFRKELSIVDLFRHPTVSSLARLLSSEEVRISASRGAREAV